MRGRGRGRLQQRQAKDKARSRLRPIPPCRSRCSHCAARHGRRVLRHRTIEAHEEAEVVAKVGGEVRQLFVEEGDVVKAGQVMARLDGDRLRLEVAQTEANLRKLERDYKRSWN